MAVLIDGKALAQRIREQTAAEAALLPRKPGLALARDDAPDIHRVERIHILLRGYRLDYRVLIYALWQRKLDKDAVYLRVGVEPRDE